MHVEDECQSWELQPDGVYRQLNRSEEECVGVQQRLLSKLGQA